MGLFVSKYKEDALKWRNHEREVREREKNRKFRMIVEISLKDGDTKYREFEMTGHFRNVGFLNAEWHLVTGESRLKGLYEDVKEMAGSSGIESDDGIFIPHSNIHHIRNAGIYEVVE